MVSAQESMIMLDECINDPCIYKTALNFVDISHASSWIHCYRMLLLVIPRKLLWEPRRLSTTSCCDLAAQIVTVKQRIHHVCEFTPLRIPPRSPLMVFLLSRPLGGGLFGFCNLHGSEEGCGILVWRISCGRSASRGSASRWFQLT